MLVGTEFNNMAVQVLLERYSRLNQCSCDKASLPSTPISGPCHYGTLPKEDYVRPVSHRFGAVCPRDAYEVTWHLLVSTWLGQGQAWTYEMQSRVRGMREG